MKISRGFTIVEVSMVLLIIGLLAASVVISKQLIDNGVVQAQVTQLETYRSAVNIFYDRYSYWPGDYPSATTTFSGTNIANGNGDGYVGGFLTGYSVPATFANEHGLVFVHLNLAGLVDNNNDGTTTFYQKSKNNPVLKTGDYRLMFLTLPIYQIVGYMNSGSVVTNFWYLGISPSFTNGSLTTALALSPYQAYGIDAKIDDGKPMRGNVTAQPDFINLPSGGTSTTPTCTTYNGTAAQAVNADYRTTFDNKLCSLRIMHK